MNIAALFSPEGRIGRLTYFSFSLVVGAIHVLVAFALYRRFAELLDAPLYKWALAIVFYFLTFGWVNFAMTTKRFHDFGKSARSSCFLFFGSGIPVVGLYSLWLIGELFFKSGEPFANEYGPPPGAPRASPLSLETDGFGDASQAKAFAAIDALARQAANGAASTQAAPHAPLRALPNAAPATFGRRKASFGGG